jgi:hypothetical protein
MSTTMLNLSKTGVSQKILTLSISFSLFQKKKLQASKILLTLSTSFLYSEAPFAQFSFSQVKYFCAHLAD